MFLREPLHTPLLSSKNTFPLFTFQLWKSSHFCDLNKELYSETKMLSPLWWWWWGSWILYTILEMDCFSSAQFLKAGYTIKRLVCRHKGNNLTGASRSVTLSAPFKNHTSSLALIFTPPSAEQITPLQFHNSARLFTHFGYGAISSFQKNRVRHCGIALRQRSFFWLLF